MCMTVTRLNAWLFPIVEREREEKKSGKHFHWSMRTCAATRPPFFISFSSSSSSASSRFLRSTKDPQKWNMYVSTDEYVLRRGL